MRDRMVAAPAIGFSFAFRLDVQKALTQRGKYV